MPKTDKKGKKGAKDASSNRLPVAPYVYRWLKPSTKMGSGGVIPKTTSLGRMIRWPRYVRLQRQKKIIMQRLKVPPAINIFNQGCSRDFAHKLVRFCKNYSPESKKQKKLRFKAQAKMQAAGKPIEAKKRMTIKSGLSEVMHLIERGHARLVLIAHDVDPIELVMWMPALCMKKNVPFVIFKSKSRLGALVHKKTTSCIGIGDVRPNDQDQLAVISKKARHLYNGRYNELKKSWGKQQLGIKTRHKIRKARAFRKSEAKKRAAAMSDANKKS